MHRRILVAYASEFGSTREIAEIIATELRASGAMVDLRLVFDVPGLEQYDAVVVGSPIYNGAWLPEAIDFVRFYAPTLERMPVAYFAVSMTMRANTAPNRRTVLAYLDTVRSAAPEVHPVDIGLFAGALNYRNLPLLERIRFVLTARLPGGDYRNWAAIGAWAARLYPLLANKQPGVDASQHAPTPSAVVEP